jgi:acyl carrier protein phosphodiesterase
MNYLAHALLSSHSPAAIVGGMLGDFVKGAIPAHYDKEVREAILTHRAIDRFTDAHELTRAGRTLVSPARRRFAGILLDVFYDHFLARHWTRYSHEPLDVFTARVYAALWSPRAQFPARLQHILPYMMAEDWLASYAELESVEAALRGIARRLQRFPRAAVLHDAVEELEHNYAAFERNFLEFFPFVIGFAAHHAVAHGWPPPRAGLADARAA